MLDLRQDGAELSFPVQVQPRASRDEVVGIEGGALLLRLKALPVEGLANEACLHLLAKLLDLKRSQLEIRTGLKSRRKVIRIKGAERATIQAKLEQLLRER